MTSRDVLSTVMLVVIRVFYRHMLFLPANSTCFIFVSSVNYMVFARRLAGGQWSWSAIEVPKSTRTSKAFPMTSRDVVSTVMLVAIRVFHRHMSFLSSNSIYFPFVSSVNYLQGFRSPLVSQWSWSDRWSCAYGDINSEVGDKECEGRRHCRLVDRRVRFVTRINLALIRFSFDIFRCLFLFVRFFLCKLILPCPTAYKLCFSEIKA